MGDKRPVRPKLWLEGLRAFRRHARDWFPSGVVFFLILAAVIFFAFVQVQAVWQALPKNLPQDMHERARLLGPLLMPGLGWLALVELIVLVQYYVWTVFFSRRELPGGQPVLGIGRFFYAFAKALQVALIFVGIGVVSGVLMAGIKYGFAARYPSVARIVLLTIRFIMQIAVFYLAIRYYFVYVLAVNKMRPVLKTGWRLTKDNWWRVLWNKLVVDFLAVLFLAAAFALGGLVNWLLRMALHMAPIVHIEPVCVAVMAALAVTLCMGVFAAYCCAACRILCEEKRQSDPDFFLTVGATPMPAKRA